MLSECILHLEREREGCRSRASELAKMFNVHALNSNN